MADTKRCPHCGGLNPAAADWCGQCLERFTPKPAAPAEPGPPPPPVSVAPAPGVATPPPADEPAIDVDALLAGIGASAASEADRPAVVSSPPPAAAVGTTHGSFTVREHGVVWTCSRCDTENPLDRQSCSVCGTTFAEVVRPKQERPERDPGMATMVSLFFPGAGHGYLGLWGQAIARGVLHAWVLFVVAMAVLQRGPGSTLIAAVFGLVATASWAANAHDAYREARHESSQVLLKGKVFLYLVLGLLVLLLVLLVSSGLRARA